MHRILIKRPKKSKLNNLDFKEFMASLAKKTASFANPAMSAKEVSWPNKMRSKHKPGVPSCNFLNPKRFIFVIFTLYVSQLDYIQHNISI